MIGVIADDLTGAAELGGLATRLGMRAAVFLGGSLEAGRIKTRFDGQPDDSTKYSASVFIAADSFLGPGFLGLGVAPGGRWNVYLILGAP